MALLEGKKGIIFGVANERSIAWSVAKTFKDEGAHVALSFPESMRSRVEKLDENLGAELLLPCDLTSDDDIEAIFKTVKDEWGEIDYIVHSVAYADKEELKGAYSDTSRAGFQIAMDVSVFSLVAISKQAAALMKSGGSIQTMSYYGAEKVIKNYNVMGVAKSALESSVRYLAADLGRRGIRVNALSPGPIKTLAAMGISKFNDILTIVDDKAPLHRNVTQEEVAKSALYLASDLSSGVTGEIIYVDSGYNVVGV